MFVNNIFKQSGFTLIEVAVVLVIIGLLVGSFIGTFGDRIETTRRNNTLKQLEEIKTALLGFAAAEGRLPCPANPLSNGEEAPVGGPDPLNFFAQCVSRHGFVPGSTLGLNGPYNRDSLLIDSWASPIRYSVTGANSYAFVKDGKMQDVTMANLDPDLIVCSVASAAGNSCSAGFTMTDNAPFVLLSLGKDGHDLIAAMNANQGENSGEMNSATNAAGENIAYPVAGDRVFVSKVYSSIDSTAGQFDDLIIWMSPYVLYSRMMEAGQLP